ncbi:MAG: T9SS type A sorting domain-containing protein [Bacteroidales bacterium]
MIIYDFQGRVIKQMIPQGLVTEIEVSDMRPGTYIVKVLYGSKFKDWKLIKQ